MIPDDLNSAAGVERQREIAELINLVRRAVDAQHESLEEAVKLERAAEIASARHERITRHARSLADALETAFQIDPRFEDEWTAPLAFDDLPLEDGFDPCPTLRRMALRAEKEAT